VPRTPLLHPDDYFESHTPGHSLGLTLALAFLVAAGSTAGVLGIGWVVTQSIDATVAVDNPAHTPDWVCEQQREAFTDQPTPEGCAASVPETVERDMGDLVWDAFVDRTPLVFVAIFVVWVVVAGVLHALSAVFGGEGSFVDTLAVAAWGGVPTLAQMVAGLVEISLQIQSLTFGSNPQQVAAEIQRLAAGGHSLPWYLVAAVVALWQAYLFAFGLVHARDLDLDAAALVAGSLALLSFLLGAFG
jgi:hypothetical protein